MNELRWSWCRCELEDVAEEYGDERAVGSSPSAKDVGDWVFLLALLESRLARLRRASAAEEERGDKVGELPAGKAESDVIGDYVGWMMRRMKSNGRR